MPTMPVWRKPVLVPVLVLAPVPVLGVNRKTVIRKFLFLAALTRQFHKAYVQKGLLPTHHAQFDEMESFEHTRLKPVTIAVVVNAKSGEIIDAKVASSGLI